MTRGPHGHERIGEEILRIRCHNCGNRVSFDSEEDEVKCPHCGTQLKRPKHSQSGK